MIEGTMNLSTMKKKRIYCNNSLGNKKQKDILITLKD